MRMHTAVWFVAGVGSVWLYHRYMKPLPTNAG